MIKKTLLTVIGLSKVGHDIATIFQLFQNLALVRGLSTGLIEDILRLELQKIKHRVNFKLYELHRPSKLSTEEFIDIRKQNTLAWKLKYQCADSLVPCLDFQN